MDLYSQQSINIVPIVAVDYSLANLTFDEQQYTIHTLKDGAPNDYIDCMKSVAKAFYHFNRFIMGYGYGARTLQDDQLPTSNIFSMTGDFMNPFTQDGNDLVQGYKNTLKNVQLALPVIYSELVKFVCDLAQRELGIRKFDQDDA